MALARIFGTLLLLLSAGCAGGPQPITALAELPSAAEPIDEAATVTQVDYEAVDESEAVDASAPDSAELIQPPTVAKPLAPAAQLMLPQCPPSTDGLTLEVLEQMALGNNPAIAQSAARVRALRGKWVQVGLKPNPTVGYLGSEIGNEGTAGQQGGFVGQGFITAQKLQRSRAVVSAEIGRAQQKLAAAQRRVLTDVRQSYYNALLAQRRVELAVELVRVASEAAISSKSLYEAEEIPLAGLLQTEVQQQNAQVFSRTAQNGLSQAWRRLSAVIGSRGLPIQPLQGDVNQLPVDLDWEAQLARVQSESPEVAAAMADAVRARRALNRACVEAVPNISTQWSVQYDDATDDTVAGVQIGLPLPIWNRNQGGIRQAQAEITEAMRNVDRVELYLNQRLADTFGEYSNARITAESYANEILPRSQRTFALVQAGYAQGEVGYLDLLAAQQTFSQTNLAYLDALGNLWQSYVSIDGLLLEGSLELP